MKNARNQGRWELHLLILLLFLPLGFLWSCKRFSSQPAGSSTPVLFTLPSLHISFVQGSLPPYLLLRTIGTASTLSTPQGLLITFPLAPTAPGAILSLENRVPLYSLSQPITFEVQYRLVSLQRKELCLGLHLFAFPEVLPRARYGACYVRTGNQSYLYLSHALGNMSETTFTHSLTRSTEAFLFRITWDWRKKEAFMSLAGVTLPVQIPEPLEAIRIRLFFLTGLLVPEQKETRGEVRFTLEKIASNLSNPRVFLLYLEGSLPSQKALFLEPSGNIIPLTSPLQELPLEKTTPCFLYSMATERGERFQVVSPLSPPLVSRFFPQSTILDSSPVTVPFWN